MTTLSNAFDPLIAQVIEAGHHASPEEAVETALIEYLRALRRKELINLIGNVDFDPAWDPAAQRSRQTQKLEKLYETLDE